MALCGFFCHLIFRKNLCFLFLAVFSICVAGCSYLSDSPDPGRKAVEYGNDFGSCVSQVSGTLNSYFDMDSIPSPGSDHQKYLDQFRSDLDAFNECYQTSIGSFVRYTKSGGAQSDEYSAENVVSFFARIYPELNLSLKKVEYYFSLKHFLIGGSPNMITKAELLRVQSFFGLFTDFLKTLLPYRPVLFGKANLEKNKDGYDKYQEAFGVLDEELKPLLEAMGEDSEDRKIDLRKLVRFFINEYRGNIRWSGGLDFIVAFKNLVSESSGDEWNRRDFNKLIQQSVLSYKIVMQFEYFVRDDDLFKGFGNIMYFIPMIASGSHRFDVFRNEIVLDSIFDIIKMSERILAHSIESNPKKQLSHKRVNDVFRGLEKSGLFGDDVKADTLIRFFNRFSRKWLDPFSSPGQGLTLAKVSYVKSMYDKWLDNQRGLNRLFSNGPEEISFTRSLPTSDFEDQRINALKEDPFFNSLKEWADFFDLISVHQWGERGVLFSKDVSGFDYREMTLNHSILWSVEFFMKPYNSSAMSVYDYRVDKVQAQEIYEVLRILGVDAKFMDSRLYDSGERAFEGGNLFGTQDRNDDFFDFYEAYEYLSMSLSAYQLSDDFYKGIPNQCLLDYRDVYGKLVIKKDCFRQYLTENFSEFFGHLSVINGFWKKSLGDEQILQEFLESLERISRQGLVRETPYELGEIRVIIGVLYYMESLFFLFDGNRDGVIHGSELKNVESHFRNFIVDFLLKERSSLLRQWGSDLALFCDGKQSPEDLAQCLAPSLFLFILREGALPTDAGLDRFLEQLAQRDQGLFEELQFGIGDVLEIFSHLGQANRDSRIKKVEEFLFNQRDDLFDELSPDPAPDCGILENQNLKFCQWKRLIFCNEIGSLYLYEWMNTHKYYLFPERNNVSKSSEAKNWNPGDAISETIRKFSSIFEVHQQFSVQCLFPYYKSKQEDSSSKEQTPLDEESLGDIPSLEELGELDELFQGL